MPAMGKQMVATSQPLAAQAGLAVLAAGGNAVDAAIAAAAALTVVEPTMNGIGSDAFALVWDGKRLHGLNGSGRAPARFTLSRFRARSTMPALGWDAVTVPGAVHAWVTLWARFGSRPFAELLAPAIAYAREGFPVTPVTAALWSAQAPRFAGFREFARVFLPGGRAPVAGEIFRNPDLADTLEDIAATTGQSLYNGALAERIAAAAAAEDGVLEAGDLADHRSTWVEPLALPFAGVVVHELPPNGQGLASLMALGILERLSADRHPIDGADAIHLQLEAMKLAFAACRRQVADPEAMMIEPTALLEPGYLDAQARLIDLARVQVPDARVAPEYGTVYLAAADATGRMVSFIQSNYLGFGSGVVVPGTGIALQNRALGFSLDPRHPNCVGGRKRPYHTIMPGFVTRGGKAAAAFGVMGGHMQPQGHVQMVMRMFGHGQNPQTACDAPRWYLSEQSDVGLEPGIGAGVSSDLAARGHRLLAEPPTVLFGGAQIIQRIGEVFWGGSDPRKDGQAIGI
ncbi:MAG TPA: gamma-glutamyltransferase family protein [Polyangia bacterium]|nr:gamma-glutamyltransferase family protein [Polyangia bacterium]